MYKCCITTWLVLLMGAHCMCASCDHMQGCTGAKVPLAAVCSRFWKAFRQCNSQSYVTSPIPSCQQLSPALCWRAPERPAGWCCTCAGSNTRGVPAVTRAGLRASCIAALPVVFTWCCTEHSPLLGCVVMLLGRSPFRQICKTDRLSTACHSMTCTAPAGGVTQQHVQQQHDIHMASTKFGATLNLRHVCT